MDDGPELHLPTCPSCGWRGAGIIGNTKTETRLQHRRGLAYRRGEPAPPDPAAVQRSRRRLQQHVNGPMHQAWLRKQAAA